MKLNEIASIESNDLNETAVKRGISLALKSRNRKSLFTFDDVDVKMASDDGSGRYVDIILVKNNVAIGFAELEKSTVLGGWYVVQIGILDRYRGNRIGYKFYLEMLKHGYTLISGRMQTPDGQLIWQRLLREPSVKTEVKNYDTGKTVQGDPWSSSDYVIVAKAA